MVLAVPRRQTVEVVQERVETWHIARIEHGLKVRPPRVLNGLESGQQGVLETVAHRLEVVADELRQFIVAAEGIFGRQSRL